MFSVAISFIYLYVPIIYTMDHFQVLSALLFFANGDYQRVAGEANLFSQATVSNFITEVTNALNSSIIVQKFIHFPTRRHERDIIKQR